MEKMKGKATIQRRPFEKIKDINDTKCLWRVAIRVKDLWIVRHSKSSKQHMDMVICDEAGDEIQLTVPTDLNEKFKTLLYCNMTCTLQNFDVEKNNGGMKACEHEFRLVCNGGTLVEDVNQHQIAKPGFKFKDFADINSGKVPSNIFIDVIGMFHEIGYTQLVPGGRKMQMNFKMKDLTGNILNCTLWEHFATQFAKFNQERSEWGPLIVLIHNARVKDASGQYEVGVSNVWNGTQLYLNADLPEIKEFQKRIKDDEIPATQMSTQSQMLTQSSSLTQYSSSEKFIGNALILPLTEVLNLSEATTVVTVVKTKRINPTQFGWYYKLCSQCSRAAKGDTFPLKCSENHLTNALNLRYKLDIDVEYEGVTATFVFWDRECNELIGHTAAELHAMMVEIGATNPCEYPITVDNILNKTIACRVKLQRTWGNYSVNAIKIDESVINKILEQFPKNEETSKLAVTQGETSKLDEFVDEVIVSDQLLQNDNASKEEEFIAPTEDLVKGKDLVMEDSNVSKENDIICPTVDLSDCSEYDPDQIQLTPSKRGATTQSVPQDNAVNSPPTGQSSTKMTLRDLKKIIKREKI